MITSLCIALILSICWYRYRRRKRFARSVISTVLLSSMLICAVLFFRYSAREIASDLVVIKCIITFLLLLLIILMLTLLLLRERNLGYAELLSALPERIRQRYNKVAYGVIFFILLSVLVHTLLFIYDHLNGYPLYSHHYGYIFLWMQFVWQYVYIIPFYMLMKHLKMERFRIAFLCSALGYTLLFTLMVLAAALGLR